MLEAKKKRQCRSEYVHEFGHICEHKGASSIARTDLVCAEVIIIGYSVESFPKLAFEASIYLARAAHRYHSFQRAGVSALIVAKGNRRRRQETFHQKEPVIKIRHSSLCETAQAAFTTLNILTCSEKILCRPLEMIFSFLLVSGNHPICSEVLARFLMNDVGCTDSTSLTFERRRSVVIEFPYCLPAGKPIPINAMILECYPFIVLDPHSGEL